MENNQSSGVSTDVMSCPSPTSTTRLEAETGEYSEDFEGADILEKSMSFAEEFSVRNSGHMKHTYYL